MRNFIHLVLALSLLGCAGMDGSGEQITARITNYGLYTVDSPSSIYNYEWEFYDETDTVEMKAGTLYGIEYVIENCSQDESYFIESRTIHPQIKERYMGNSIKEQDCSKIYITGWLFEEDNELAEGDYTIQILFEDRLLTKKTFKLVNY